MSAPHAIATHGYISGADLIGGPPTAGAQATSATTTWTAIRRQMIATIKPLTPSSMSQHSYRVTDTEMADFSEHVLRSPQSSFREYEIEMLTDEISGIQNNQIEMRVIEAELVMAYPNTWGQYRTKEQTNTWNERTLRAVANEDRNIIDKAIGIRGGANYVAAQRSCSVGTVEFEERQGVTLMVLELEVTYFHSSS